MVQKYFIVTKYDNKHIYYGICQDNFFLRKTEKYNLKTNLEKVFVYCKPSTDHIFVCISITTTGKNVLNTNNCTIFRSLIYVLKFYLQH